MIVNKFDIANLERVLDRTQAFAQALSAVNAQMDFPTEARQRAAFSAARVSTDYWLSILVLIESSLFTPAFAMSRPQFESLIRGVWLLYAAPVEWVERLLAPLTPESAKEASDCMGINRLLEELKRCQACPAPLLQQLESYRDVMSKASNNYVHAGLFALAHARTGTPVQLICEVIYGVNAISTLATQLQIVTTDNHGGPEQLRRIYHDYADVLPLAHGPSHPVPA